MIGTTLRCCGVDRADHGDPADRGLLARKDPFHNLRIDSRREYVQKLNKCEFVPIKSVQSVLDATTFSRPIST
jgi:hypothetical protein